MEPSGSGDAIAHGADAVDVTLHDVTAEAVGEAHRTFEVDRITGVEATERRAVEGLGDRVGGPAVVEQLRPR